MRALSITLLLLFLLPFTGLFSSSTRDTPQVDEPYVAVVTHWQTGERVVYRSVEIYDGATLVRGPELPRRNWEAEICNAPDRRAALLDLDNQPDRAATNRNLTPRLRAFTDVTASIDGDLGPKLDDAIAQACRPVDFSTLEN